MKDIVDKQSRQAQKTLLACNEPCLIERGMRLIGVSGKPQYTGIYAMSH